MDQAEINFFYGMICVDLGINFVFLFLRVCLVEWILVRMEEKWEKMMRENFLESVWLREGEGKMIVGPTKKFSP